VKPEIVEIVDRWWPSDDTTPRKSRETLESFGLAMLNCQVELIAFHLEHGHVERGRRPIAYKTIQDLRERGASL
jgi:hypothetical protein